MNSKSAFARLSALTVLLGLGVIGVSLMGVGPSIAQNDGGPERRVTGPPVGIVPAPGQAPQTQQSGDFGGSFPPDKELKSIDARPGLNDGGVTVGTLDTVDLSAVAPSQAVENALPATLWAGSQRSNVIGLLRRIPTRTMSAAMNDLKRRILLSAVTPPSGQSNGQSLLAIRTELLYQAGNLEDVVSLTDGIPKSVTDEDLMRLRVDALLLLGRNDPACETTDRIRLVAKNDYWGKVGAFCQFSRGNDSAAGLTVDFLREREDEDKFFFTLMDRALGYLDELPNGLVADEALDIALLRSVDADPIGYVDPLQMTPPFLSALAHSPSGTFEQRLVLGEMAAQIGAISTRQLERLYALYPFQPEEIANAKTDWSSKPPSVGQALLYQATGATTSVDRRIELLSTAWHLGERQGIYPITTRVMQRYANQITPDIVLAWAAGDFLQSSLSVGDAERAFAWYELVDVRSARAGVANTQTIQLLKPDLWIAKPTERLPWRKRDVEELHQIAWAAEQKTLGTVRKFQQKLRMLEALGYRVPKTVLSNKGRAAFEDTSLPPESLPFLINAGEENKMGETILLTLISLGADGPGAASTTTMTEVITALSRVGLISEARALALEASLAPIPQQQALGGE